MQTVTEAQVKAGATRAGGLGPAMTYSQRIDNLGTQEQWKWYHGAKGGLFRVVTHDNGRLTRVYWKDKPGHPKPVAQGKVGADVRFADHHKR
jgi:hypothetical protein